MRSFKYFLLTILLLLGDEILFSQVIASGDYPGNSITAQDRGFSNSGPTAVDTFIVSGVIRLNGSPLEGVSVTLSGAYDSTIVTGIDGAYSFPVLTGSTVTVIPSKIGCIFFPNAWIFSNVTENQVQDFVTTLVFHTIGGTITQDGVPLSGVNVIISGSKDSTIVTGADGRYSYMVAAGGTYVITPSRLGYAFSPMNQTFTNVHSNWIQDFMAVSGTKTLSGVITSNGNNLSEVVVTLSGTSSAIDTTNTSGAYSFTVAVGGSYTITPTKPNYSFTPQNIAYVNLFMNQVQNFVGVKNIHTISGAVTVNGIGVSGIAIHLSGDKDSTIVTDSAGRYSFSVTAGGNYHITPSHANYVFAPLEQIFTNLSNDTVRNFTGDFIIYLINGNIISNGVGLSGVTVTCTGDTTRVVMTDINGFYVLLVHAGGTYTITPTKTDYVFDPIDTVFVNLSENKIRNFVGTYNNVSISGLITVNGNGLEAVTVTLSGSSSSVTTTNAIGGYSFLVPKGGTYTVTPSKEYYAFNPLSKTFTNITTAQVQYFTAIHDTNKISGTITFAGAALSGVTVVIGGSMTASTTTDSSGKYSFTVNRGGTYSVTPAKINYSFNPTTQTFSNVTIDQIQNFSAALNTFTISGKVLYNNLGFSGVSLSLTGGATGLIITDSTGRYSFTINAGENYTVTPLRTNYSFVPSIYQVTNISGNQTQDFIASLMPPDVPKLVTPAYNSTGLPTALALIWDPSNRADSYQIQVATDVNFMSIFLDQNNISGTSLSISGLGNNMVYYWRVRGINVGGISNWSEIWYFSTQIGIPNPPRLSYPDDNSILLPVNLVLTWSRSYSAVYYDVQVALNSNFNIPSIVASQNDRTDTSFVLNNLLNATTYYWRVRAKNSSGSSRWANFYTFATIGTIPSRPTLLSPLNNENNISTNPKFIWNASPGAATYQLQLSADSNFNNILYDAKGISTTSFVVTNLINETEYYWRVRAANSLGIGDWSNIWKFRTTEEYTTIPTTKSPPNGASNIELNPTLKWYAIIGIISYDLQISLNPTFSNIVLNRVGLTGTSYSLEKLLSSTTYFWRIRGTNGVETTDWSSPSYFTTKEVTGVVQKNDIASDYALKQNYPNPFNHLTNIEFRIADFSFVTLKIYNIHGSEISTLLNKILSSGEYSITFDAKDLPSGVYYCRLQAGKFSEMKKIIYMK
jgi:hypothetical protein